MSKWGNPADYECRVLVDPDNNGWKTVATPEEAEKYPVNEIRYKRAAYFPKYEGYEVSPDKWEVAATSIKG